MVPTYLGPNVQDVQPYILDKEKIMSYEYKMVQIPPNIEVDARKHKGNEAAHYLETVVNSYANEGWEFQRIDNIGVKTSAGCLAALGGHKESFSNYHVITFRRPRT